MSPNSDYTLNQCKTGENLRKKLDLLHWLFDSPYVLHLGWCEGVWPLECDSREAWEMAEIYSHGQKINIYF